MDARRVAAASASAPASSLVLPSYGARLTRHRSSSPSSSAARVESRSSGSTPHSQQGVPTPGGSDGSRDLERALLLARASWRGELPDEDLEWEALHVTPVQFVHLRERLSGEDPGLGTYFDEALRFDYDPDRELLVLRLMEGPAHEVTKDAVIRHIWSRLDIIKSADPGLSGLISNIIPHGNARVAFSSQSAPEAPAGKCPDGQTRYRGTSLPQFVLEVAYSQGTRALRQVVKQHIRGSEGEIKTVLTIDITYPRERAKVDRSATVSLYRGTQRIHRDVLFRDAHGNPVVGHSVQLFLADFVPDVVLRGLEDGIRNRVQETTIDIPAQLLYEILGEAETHQAAYDTEKKEPRASRAGKRKAIVLDWTDSESGDEDDPDDETQTSQRASGPKTHSTRDVDDHPSCHGVSSPGTTKRVCIRDNVVCKAASGT